MSFILAQDLRKMFYTEGVFYTKELNGEKFACRSVARIRRKGADTTQADAVFVMVNPGSCEPVAENYEYPPFVETMNDLPFVPARSDQTQYQIMRLMERKRWDLVDIVNLSDLRAGKIQNFRSYIQKFNLENDNTHSIFSENRIEEVRRLVGEDTVIIAAWGTHRAKRQRMIDAIEILTNMGEVNGLPHETAPYYYHPFPMVKEKCIKWLDDICLQLEAK